MFMDVHDDLGDATPEDVASDHARDLQVQEKYGVHYLTYWLNDSEGRLLCLVEAPSIEAAVACHEEAHGLIPHKHHRGNASLGGPVPGRLGGECPVEGHMGAVGCACVMIA